MAAEKEESIFSEDGVADRFPMPQWMTLYSFFMDDPNWIQWYTNSHIAATTTATKKKKK